MDETLEAGPELDRMVIQAVTGFPEPQRLLWLPQPELNKRTGFAPSRNMNDAWELAEYIYDHGGVVIIKTASRDGTDRSFSATVQVLTSQATTVFHAYAPTAPLAFCRAVMMAYNH